MKNTFLCLFILLISICSYSQEKQLLPKGVIVDSVKIANTDNESYAVYLPKQYRREVPSAIVFIFDPGGRGKVGIEPFVLAAETYKYILVCSNNSKNGPTDVNLEIANHLFESVSTEFNLNPSELYISGFSGGARLAGSMAVSSGAFQGVIACGASFNEMDKFALHDASFSYVGMVGDKDMNYQEMIKNEEWLNKMMVKNTLFVSHQIHTWPSQKEMLRAFDWLEIQASKNSIRKPKETTIKKIYDENLKIADSLKGKNEMILAIVEYERCNAIYDNRGDEKIKTTIDSIKKSKEYENQISKRDEVSVLENEITNSILNQFDKELKVAKSENDFKFWKIELKKLDDRKTKSKDIAIKNMVDRIKFMTKALVYEAAQESKRNFQNDKLLYCKELEKVIQLYDSK
ncbi:hypothetical protein DOS84_06815 [Flavobacterium aquariorum]|uniref:Phospholipase/carboxylesterase/thioesterase domain-containing protein n=1 Tax=Flavobacterium aquariorum TaxID=2217670 RepID=A0A2W7TZR0_9FLAO|nr:hypothetical protein [Flavobacterium aquariorum]PZX94330.1 hypothetical protein DOS84_06815 [Flavobacterium aquariorum]